MLKTASATSPSKAMVAEAVFSMGIPLKAQSGEARILRDINK